MKIAVPYENGQVFQNFGRPAQFKTQDTENGKILSSEIVSTNSMNATFRNQIDIISLIKSLPKLMHLLAFYFGLQCVQIIHLPHSDQDYMVEDALYGTGFHGSLRPAGLAACALMNRQRESGAFVLAVDLTSGINTDTGEAAEGAVRADLTVTFDSCKSLHTAPSSAPFCGEIVYADIGIRDEWHPAGLAQL